MSGGPKIISGIDKLQTIVLLTEGMVPFNSLKSKSKTCKFVSPPKKDGIVPVIIFCNVSSSNANNNKHMSCYGKLNLSLMTLG